MNEAKKLVGERVTRSLDRRSVALIWLLATLTLGGLTLFWIQTRTLESGAAVVNLSGRQRMLTQRSVLLMQRLAYAPESAAREALRRELTSLADTLESSHHALIGRASTDAGRGPGSVDRLGSEARHVYHSPPRELHAKTLAFLDDLRLLIEAEDLAPGDPRLRRLADAVSPDRLLADQDAAVLAFQRREEAKLSWLRRAQVVIWLLALVAIEGLRRVLLKPMVSRVGLRFDEVRRQQEMLRLILEHTPQGIANCDMSGRFLNANKALTRLLRCRQEDLLGRTFLDFTHPSDAASASSWLHRAARGEVEAYELNQRFLLSGGEVLRGVFRGAVIRPDGDQSAVLIAQFEDHTEQLQTEEALRANHERMAHVSRLSTMGEMAAGIAHEVNQPLSAIILYADACKRLIHKSASDPGAGSESLAESLTEPLGKISRQAHRAGEVIRRIRSLGTRHDVDYERRDLNELLRQTLALASTYAGFHDVRLKVTYGDDLPAVSVDPIQIQQVILNLIKNAVEAQLQEQSQDAICVATRQAAQDTVELAVTDFGGGLAEGLEDHLFEPFFSTKEGGMGMGLSISRSIIGNHGGRLGFRPNPDFGSTFFFHLPTVGPRPSDHPE